MRIHLELEQLDEESPEAVSGDGPTSRLEVKSNVRWLDVIRSCPSPYISKKIMLDLRHKLCDQ